MKVSVLLVILVINFSSFAFAQMPGRDAPYHDYFYKYENVDGTPYTSKEFRKASLDNTEGEAYMIRYDAHQDMLQFLDESDSIKVLSPNKLYRFDFVEENGAYLVVIYPKLGNGFGFLLWENESGMQLIRKEEIKVNPERGLRLSFQRVRYSYYIRKKRYGDLIRIPHRRKRAVYFFGNEVAKASKQKKLDLKKEDDLITFIKLACGE